MTTKRGRLIVIEGGDGVGKGTCIDYLREKLVGESVIFTREPGGTEVGEEIRTTLLDHRHEFFEPLAELYLFAASRTQHVGQKIKPAIESGVNVICDRFAASSFAYQVRGNDRPELEKIFSAVHEPILQVVSPDLYVLLDVDPQIAERRMDGRGDKSRLDEKALDYHARVRQGYIDYLKDKPHVVVDASLPLEQIKEVVWQAVREELTASRLVAL